MRAHRVMALGCLLGLLSCKSPATQLIVVVDTDYRVPSEMGHVRVVIRDDEGQVVSTLDRDLIPQGVSPSMTRTTMPFSFAVVPKDDDATRMISIEVRGLDRDGGNVLVTQKAETGFRAEDALLLDIFLARSCESIWQSCGNGLTCLTDSCESDRRPPDSLGVVEPGTELTPFPRSDAGTPGTDGGVPQMDAGSADGGVDGGSVDGGPPGMDGGVPDSGVAIVCGSNISDPTEMSFDVSLPAEVNQPLAIDDVDGDGLDEIVAIHRQAGSSVVMLVDFEDCSPVVTSVNVGADLISGPIVVHPAGGAEIWAATAQRIMVFGKGSSGVEMRRELPVETTVSFVSGSPDGTQIGAVIERTSFGLQSLNASGSEQGFVATSEPLLTSLAYLPGSPHSFVGGGASSLMRADSASAESLSATVVQRPTVVASGIAEEVDRDTIVAPAGNGIFLVPAATPVNAQQVGFGSPLVSEIVPVPEDSSKMWLAFVLASGDVRTCRLRTDATNPICTVEEEDHFSFSSSETLGDGALLSAFVNSDTRMDLVVIRSSGRIHFLRIDETGNQIAPSVDLQRNALGHAAIAERFFERYAGAVGHLLAVPVQGSKIALVGFVGRVPNRPTWPQARRDAAKSAALLP